MLYESAIKKTKIIRVFKVKCCNFKRFSLHPLFVNCKICILFSFIFLITFFLASLSYSHACFDYIIDIQLSGFGINSNQYFNNEASDVVEFNIGKNTIRLNLSFSLRQSVDTPANLQSLEVSETEDFRQGIKFNVQGSGFSYFIMESKEGRLPVTAMANVIQDAVRNFYERFSRLTRNAFEEQGNSQRLTSVISAAEKNRISVPLGRSDLVRDEDVFHVYTRGGCSINRHFGYYLTTAIVAEIDEHNSMLLLRPMQGGYKRVQVGDIVELSRDIDLDLRTEIERDTEFKMTLKAGPFNIFIDKKILNGEFISGDITFYIKSYLVTEGRKFGFQVIL